MNWEYILEDISEDILVVAIAVIFFVLLFRISREDSIRGPHLRRD